jgi:large subunit ribosomal protein L23
VFSVDVIKINVMTVNGKERTTGRYKGFRPKRKKAIVTLKPGQRITQLEGLS